MLEDHDVPGAHSAEAAAHNSTHDAEGETHMPSAAATEGQQAQGKGQEDDNTPLNIATIGDIFIERFLWSDSDSTTSSRQLPYTAPEDLRTHDFTNTFVELSGAPLHADIYESLLTACMFDIDKDFTVARVPNRAEIIDLANNLLGIGGHDPAAVPPGDEAVD
jgi:hypothetical protein